MSSVDNKSKNINTSAPKAEPTNEKKAEKSLPLDNKPTWNDSTKIKYDGLIKPLAGSKKPYSEIKHQVDDSTPVGYRPAKDTSSTKMDDRPDWNLSIKIDRKVPMRPLAGTKKTFPALKNISPPSRPDTLREGEPLVEDKKVEPTV